MLSTWPFFNPLEIQQPPFQVRADFSPGALTTSGVKIQILSPKAWPFRHLTSAILGYRVEQSIDFDGFLPETMEEQEEYDPDQENDFELSEGPHTHTLFLTHEVNAEIMREVRRAEDHEHPSPVLVSFTFQDHNGNPSLRSLYMGNIVQHKASNQIIGSLLTKTTAVQCFGIVEYEDYQEETDLELWTRMMSMSFLNALQYPMGDEDESDNFEFKMDEDDE
jgi:hypothetical protein